MAGNSAQAIASARQVIVKSPLEMVRMVPVLEYFLPTPYFALARFGRWEEMLREPAPPTEFQYTTALWHYARSLALAANGDVAGAEAEAQALQAAAANVAEDQVVGINSARPIVEIAGRVLAGEIARKRGQLPEAIREFEAAMLVENSLQYDEPSAWYHPVRQILGSALLEAGQPAEAEAAYREDLRRNPNNGWSLFGLAQALRAQGKMGEAEETDRAFRAAWVGSDVTLTSSRF
jgi:tetratricopeptide (TPR) repeat protein